MGQIPTYGGRKIALNPLPGVQETGRQASGDATSFGKGIGDALAQGGLALDSELIAHQQAEALRQDQARVVAAENGVAQWELKSIYDPKDGALAQTGTKAFGLPDQIQKSWDENIGTIRAGLSNDRQREAFDRSTVARKDSIFKTVNAHVMGQMRAVESDSNKSYIANSFQLAVANAGDPERIAQEIDNSRVHAGMYAQAVGMDAESTKRYVNSVTSDIHVGVLDQLLASGQDVKARNYFDAAKDEIDATSLPKVERALQIGSTDGEEQRLTKGIVGNWQADPDSASMDGGVVSIQAGREKTLQEALDQADKITDPKMQDAVKQRIRQSYADYKTTQNEAQQQASAYTKQVLDEAIAAEKDRKARLASDIANGVIAAGVTDANVFTFIDRIAPGQRALMSPQELSMWKSYAKQMSEKDTVTTDLGTYYGLLQLGSTDPEKFKGVNLQQFHATISEPELKELMRAQAAMIKDESKPDKLFSGFRSIEQIVDSAMVARGMKADVKIDTPAGAEKARAIQMLSKQITDFENSRGKPATEEDKQSMMDHLIIEKKIPGFLYGENVVTGFAPTPKSQPGRVTIADIPAQAARDIRAALRAKNAPVSDDVVVDVYIKTHGTGQ